jgi:hypothetical protein
LALSYRLLLKLLHTSVLDKHVINTVNILCVKMRNCNAYRSMDT